ncbi:MAG: hypothetical protein C0420_05855, partial [Methylobacterium sp.]|nr:hypothetical protein [Methylobacterium sp.]
MFSASEKEIASRLLAVLSPHFGASIDQLQGIQTGLDKRERDPELRQDELTKYRLLFGLDFGEAYIAAKQRIVARANRNGIELSDYPLFFLADFSHFLPVIVAKWKR